MLAGIVLCVTSLPSAANAQSLMQKLGAAAHSATAAAAQATRDAAEAQRRNWENSASERAAARAKAVAAAKALPGEAHTAWTSTADSRQQLTQEAARATAHGVATTTNTWRNTEPARAEGARRAQAAARSTTNATVQGAREFGAGWREKSPSNKRP